MTNSTTTTNTSTEGSVAGGKGGLIDSPPLVEVDDFVIISAGTPFQEVVSTVLGLLGYPKETIQQAEGSILLRNWKPLRLDQVSDSPHKTVGDILNDLTNHATLRVLVTRAKGGSAEDLKEKLLRLLLAQSSNILTGSGCPLDEGTLTQLVKGQWPQNLAEDVKRRFDQWYSSHQHKLPLDHHNHHHSHPHLLSPGGHHHHHHPNNNNGPPSSSLPHFNHHHHNNNNNNNNGSTTTTTAARLMLEGSKGMAPFNVIRGVEDGGPGDELHSHLHPVFHGGGGLGTQKTRMRTSFDPEMELPRLQQWFAENPHPSRHQIQTYVRQLNALECRKDRKPLDLNNVIYWFKNARAAQKRNELRYNGYSPSHTANTFHHHITSQHSSSSSHHNQHHLNHHHHHNHNSLRDERGGGQTTPSPLHSSSNPGEEDRDCSSSCRGDSEADSSKDYATRDEAMEEGGEITDQKDTNTGNGGDDEGNKDNLDGERDGDDEDVKGHNTIVVKEEQTEEDFISVDVELTEGSGEVKTNKQDEEDPEEDNKPRDLSSGKGGNNNNSSSNIHHEGDEEEEESRGIKRESERESSIVIYEGGGGGVGGEETSHSTSSSVSPRSSPSPSSHPYDFVGGAPSMVSRFHPFFDHPFMAYRHFNSFGFGGSFIPSSPPGPGGDGPSPSNNNNNNSPGAAAAAAAAVAYESALNMIGRSNKLGIAPGKPSPGGLEAFHEFHNGNIPTVVASRGAGSSSNGGGGGRDDYSHRIRGEELFGVGRVGAPSAELLSSMMRSGGDLSSLGGLDERRKRNRTFIDPVTEVPRLEGWFTLNTHPSHNLILKYTDELNRMPYRQKFPKLEPKNVQFWFKNRRAKCKRLKMTL